MVGEPDLDRLRRRVDERSFQVPHVEQVEAIVSGRREECRQLRPVHRSGRMVVETGAEVARVAHAITVGVGLVGVGVGGADVAQVGTAVTVVVGDSAASRQGRARGTCQAGDEEQQDDGEPPTSHPPSLARRPAGGRGKSRGLAQPRPNGSSTANAPAAVRLTAHDLDGLACPPRRAPRRGRCSGRSSLRRAPRGRRRRAAPGRRSG